MPKNQIINPPVTLSLKSINSINETVTKYQVCKKKLKKKALQLMAKLKDDANPVCVASGGG